MTNDIDLDAIEARLGIGGDRSIDDDDVRTLIAAVRSERARADAAEKRAAEAAAVRDELLKDRWAYTDMVGQRDDWQGRALAAEAELDSLRTLQETTMDALRVTAEERNASEPFMRAFAGVSAEDLERVGTLLQRNDWQGVYWTGKALSAIATHLRAQDEPKLDPSDIVCDGCGVSEPEHAKYCGEPAYERQVDEAGRTAPDRCGEWVTRAEYEKREPSGEYRDLARAIVAQIHGLTEPKREPSGSES